MGRASRVFHVWRAGRWHAVAITRPLGNAIPFQIYEKNAAPDAPDVSVLDAALAQAGVS